MEQTIYPDDGVLDDDTLKIVAAKTLPASAASLDDAGKRDTSITWPGALKEVMPIFIATHLAFLVLTYLASLFRLSNFSYNGLPLTSLVHSWDRWDSGQYTHIATYGYDAAWRTAFFPSFPLLEHLLAFVVVDPFVAGLIISNLCTLGVFLVLYRLVAEDFSAEQAWRTVLYLAVFPTAFFFATAYNESLFLLLALLSFYHMRKGHWWLAALAALLASLTRSSAICLFFPFIYEYFRQHDFQWRKFRPSVICCVSMAGGIGIFALYCYLTFHDPLAFSHAEAVWKHQLSFPWSTFIRSLGEIRRTPILSFTSIHNVIDLSAVLFILLLLVLACSGPWKLARSHWSYLAYAIPSFLFATIMPLAGGQPLASGSRYMLELFPAFIVLAALGQRRSLHLYYLGLALPLLAFLLLQWLTGGWIV